MLFSLLKRLAPPQTLPGRDEPVRISDQHFVLGTAMRPPYPDATAQAVFAMGCFWGAERCFWTMEGVYSTMVGYIAGTTHNPTYYEVCTGNTGHSEAVRVVFFPEKVSYEKLLKVFWQSHNPTQGMRQGNDVGTQYRSGIYVLDDGQLEQARASEEAYQATLTQAGYRDITTEIIKAPEFYYAEDYHQQYLAKNPGGYCGLGGTRVKFPD